MPRPQGTLTHADEPTMNPPKGTSPVCSNREQSLQNLPPCKIMHVTACYTSARVACYTLLDGGYGHRRGLCGMRDADFREHAFYAVG